MQVQQKPDYPLDLEGPVALKVSQILELVFKAIALAMSVAAVVLSLLNLVTLEQAVILLGVGIIALALDRLSEK